MKFEQFYSGSRGNLYAVTARNGDKLMLECGVRWKDIQKAFSYRLNNIKACFISHADHQDHSKAIKDVLKAGIDVYTSFGSWSVTDCNINRRAHIISHQTLVRLESFEVLTFDTNHDAKEPVGFVIREKATKEFLLFATDTSHIQYKLVQPFSVVAIECSYDKVVLAANVESGEVDEALAKRLLTSHMEKQVCINHLDKFDLSKCHEIHLLHLSGGNIDKAKIKKEFEKRYMREIIICGETNDTHKL